MTSFLYAHTSFLCVQPSLPYVRPSFLYARPSLPYVRPGFLYARPSLPYVRPGFLYARPSHPEKYEPLEGWPAMGYGHFIRAFWTRVWKARYCTL